jgi:hypothetical protein
VKIYKEIMEQHRITVQHCHVLILKKIVFRQVSSDCKGPIWQATKIPAQARLAMWGWSLSEALKPQGSFELGGSLPRSAQLVVLILKLNMYFIVPLGFSLKASPCHYIKKPRARKLGLHNKNKNCKRLSTRFCRSNS